MHFNFLSCVNFPENCLCPCEKAPLMFFNVLLLKMFCLKLREKTETLWK